MTTQDANAAEDLVRPYEPQMVYYPGSNVAEYLTRDCGCYYEEVGDGAALVRDMETREVVGFRIEDPEAWARAVRKR